MITLGDKNTVKLETEYSGLKVRSDKVMFKTNNSNAIIPSKLYPLSNRKKIQLFSYLNTEETTDTKLKELFNGTTFSIGRCYQNTRDIYEKLSKEGYEELEMYVGWILNGGLPIHHSWLVYKGNQVIDGSIGQQDSNAMKLVYKRYADNPTLTKNELREIQVEFLVKQSKLPHSETRTFGRVVDFFVYVGTPCAPEEGRSIFNKLLKDIPNHPAYAAEGMNSKGASKSQVLLEKELKSKR